MSMNVAPTAVHIPEWTTGERLRKAREDAGLSQDDLAREISISKRQIIYYENNAKTPKRGEFLLWQMLTRVPAEWLETGTFDQGGRGPDGTSPAIQELRFSPVKSHPSWAPQNTLADLDAA